MFYLQYFVYPSSGLYKAIGNCGAGQETLLALIETGTCIANTKVEIIELASCYNAYETLIEDDELTAENLMATWKNKQILNLKKVNHREDSSQTIVINPKQKSIVHIE